MTCATAAPTKIGSLLRDYVAGAPPFNEMVLLDEMPMVIGLPPTRL